MQDRIIGRTINCYLFIAVGQEINKLDSKRTYPAIRSIALGILTALAIGAYGCAKVTPSHDIRVKPEYIEAGVQTGDLVEITTKDGEQREFVVEEVAANAIKGPSETIPFSEIESIVKRSWKQPAHPCGGELPLGCSIPEVVLLLSNDYKRQADKFHPACVTHDFCYRHGFATYGTTREECDTVIYEDMKKACKGLGGLGALDVKEFSLCQLAANRTYEAIRRYGEQHFQTTASTYCEYRDDP